MATPIRNQEVINQLINTGKLQHTVDKIPLEFAEKIVPTLDCNPEKIIFIKSLILSDGTTQTIHTCSTTKKTYLTGIILSVSKDIVSTSIHSFLTVTPKGQNAVVAFMIKYEPTTAGQHTANQSYSFPILLEKGSIITLNNSTAVASIDLAGQIFYYEVD